MGDSSVEHRIDIAVDELAEPKADARRLAEAGRAASVSPSLASCSREGTANSSGSRDAGLHESLAPIDLDLRVSVDSGSRSRGRHSAAVASVVSFAAGSFSNDHE